MFPKESNFHLTCSSNQLPMPSSKRYSEKIIVSSEHIDQLNHVNNVVYLKWVQHIAEKHWRHLSLKPIQEQFIWVVLSHFIEYKRPALLGDELKLETYVESFEGVKSIRRVNVFKGEQLLVTAKTEWCMLDAKTMRPKRVTEEIIKPFFE